MFKWLLRTVANHYSCADGVKKLNILTYHRVDKTYDKQNPKNINLALFKQQISWLNKYFHVLPLSKALELQANNSLPARSVCITVDDGYRDSYDLIFKTLQQEGISGAFFISTDGITKGGLWNEEISSAIFQAPEAVKQIEIRGKKFDLTSLESRVEARYQLTEYTKYLPLVDRKKALKEISKQTNSPEMTHDFLTVEQIKEMHLAGMTIGAHTHSHPILLKEDNDVAFEQIQQSKIILEEVIKAPVDYFAYPNGKYGQDFDQRHMDMIVKLGFKAALSTDWGSLSNFEQDKYRIKRFTPWDGSEYKFALRLALNYRN